jgi:hypothetical protein
MVANRELNEADIKLKLSTAEQDIQHNRTHNLEEVRPYLIESPGLLITNKVSEPDNVL